MVRLFSILIFLLSALITNAQEDLFDLLDDGPQPTQFTYATFKGTKLLNGQTNETPGKGVLQYIISHRFGSFTDEYLYNFFGLDNAHIRMQLDYGISDRLNVGIGRSSVLKTSDTFVKYRALRQKTGANTFPFSLTLYSALNYRGARYTDGIDHNTSDRLSYQHQAVFARKFDERISLILAPSVVHGRAISQSVEYRRGYRNWRACFPISSEQHACIERSFVDGSKPLQRGKRKSFSWF